MLVQATIYSCLVAIAFFDFKMRAVYTWLFPVLGISLLCLKMLELKPVFLDGQIAINLLFLTIQFAVLQLYFKIKTGVWGQIMDKKMGWGDVAFLLCIALYLPFLLFFTFYVVSLIIILGMTAALPKWRKSNIGIPLAGCQALLFGFCLALEKLNVLDWETLLINGIEKLAL